MTTDLSEPIGKVRFVIGDRVDGSGVLPGGVNFTDEEVDYALDSNGGDVNAAALMLLKAAQTKWAVAPSSFSANGMSVGFNTVKDQLQTLVSQLEAGQGVNADGYTTSAVKLSIYSRD